MSESRPAVELVLVWHHHQPDYRHPEDGRALLPWVWLHASKDYLDMALRLERHPGMRVAFNFVPSLLDQIEGAESGAGDAFIELLRRPVDGLDADGRAELLHRCSAAPRHALERWPAYRALLARLSARGGLAAASERDLLRLECWFLLAWVDPMFHDEPEAASAIAAAPSFKEGHRDGLLALHRRLVGRVVPAYRALARSGRVEISQSPYFHPIVPLLVDLRAAHRATPRMTLPHEPFTAPEDAEWHVSRARERHVAAFGQPPAGMWPPEGSVSPEAAALYARAGIRWIATDEGVLWMSLAAESRRRELLYQPWRCRTEAGEIALFFRDRELSDRIGFVYQNWNTAEAVADFLERLRRIGREAGDGPPPVVTVILDGENCWEYYPDDGGPFLDALYSALEAAPDIATRTPSEVLDRGREMEELPGLHSGSWIDADFHIWIGHPEKNRAWDLLSRTRRALVERGLSPSANPEVWESLYAAEGSDWFWWFGDDHYTADKQLFDRLFRAHLSAAYRRAGLAVPAWLEVPIGRARSRQEPDRDPLGLIHPTVDGRRTGYYEWHGAGRVRVGAGGGSMHREAGTVSDLFFGCDLERLYVRLDFAGGRPPGSRFRLDLDLLAPSASRIVVLGLEAGEPAVHWMGGEGEGQPVEGARCAVDRILELALPFTSLGVSEGVTLEFLARLVHDGKPVENLPADDLMRLRVPGANDPLRLWSA